MAMAEKELERIYVIPLRGAKHGPSSKAAPRAIKTIRKFLSRHMKVDTEKIWIDESVNHAIWSRGKYKIPSKIRVRAVRFDDGVVEVSLPEVEFKSFREELKVIKESKKPILKKKEEEAEEIRKAAEEQNWIPVLAIVSKKICFFRDIKAKEYTLENGEEDIERLFE